ncbi:hypothetical protein CYLTODRAFT_492326 [Cylindrobasidium torrendii FP15055 ss-10]|uniref:Uncharacterized protein n=1 Tax=Cylindrobasidium torrendii FP15055 ss-10 TaxID=1314674 RepID=A0A0D7B5H3_9AGAR|nr:hypothetical protein CYLTODRAFT_492326 [Cylindrobasidium torrendii FP15055 ss-10]
METPNTVALQKNSIYIVTQTIPHEGAVSINPLAIEMTSFHWCFMTTNSAGLATQHHWNRTNIPGLTVFGESYQHRVHPQVVVHDPTARIHYIVFARIGGWQHPETEDVIDVLGERWAMFNGTNSVHLRAIGKSCRTWITEILCKVFVPAEWIVGREDVDASKGEDAAAEWANGMENAVKELSINAVQRLADGGVENVANFLPTVTEI